MKKKKLKAKLKKTEKKLARVKKELTGMRSAAVGPDSGRDPRRASEYDRTFDTVQ